MSKRKDVDKTNKTRKSSTVLSKSTPNIRDGSTERKKVEKVETPIKKRTKVSSSIDVARKLSENEKSEKFSSKPTTSSGLSHKPSVDLKLASSRSKPEVPVIPTSSRVSKTQFFPSKNMYSHALDNKNLSMKVGDSNINIIKRSDSSLSRKPDIVKKISSSQDLSSRKSKTPVMNKSGTAIKISSSRKLKPSEKVISDKSSISLKSTDDMKSKTEVGPISLESKSEYTSPDSSTLSERPRTATLKRGSIVNTNIVGPDVPKSKKSCESLLKLKQVSSETLIPDDNEIFNPITLKSENSEDGGDKSKSISPKSVTSEYENYEEDFDSYESDFEQYSSSTSANLDNISGEETSSVSSDSNIEVPIKTIPESKRVISTGSEEERKLDSGHFDMSDYKHKHMLDNIKESVEKENSTLVLMNNPSSLSDEGFEDQKSLQFINFLDAKKKHEQRRSVEIKEKRGKEILSMIRLDSYSFTLFDLSPVPYEIYMRSYGTNNTIQTASQTGEDDIDEEIQTEEVLTQTKWTQIPISFSNGDQEDPNYWRKYKQEYLGVGGMDDQEEKSRKPLFDEFSLNKFLNSAGDLILRIQKESRMTSTEKVRKNPKPVPFSDGYISFNTSTSIFEGTTVKCVSFSNDINSKVMTVHLRQSEVLDSGSLVAIWNIYNSDEPEAVYLSYGIISCCSFGEEKLQLVFAGLNDGTLSIWETSRKINSQFSNNVPVYSTGVGFGHKSRIVALHPVGHSTKDYFVETSSTNEICSLDENGEIILWTVILKNMDSEIVPNEVCLVINATVSLKTIHPNLIDLQCTDFVISNINTNFAFISTNYGFIVHHLIKGGRSNVKQFLPETTSKANCVDTCPFIPDYFFAGFENGDINLYSRVIETPLMVLSDKESRIDECSIELIQWSKNKPFVIYSKDRCNTIHIWDLSESDIVPIYSIPIGKDITCMKLSPSIRHDEIKKSYMMIGTRDGLLFLHQLNEEHGQQPSKIFEEHVRTFLNYVNRL